MALCVFDKSPHRTFWRRPFQILNESFCICNDQMLCFIFKIFKQDLISKNNHACFFINYVKHDLESSMAFSIFVAVIPNLSKKNSLNSRTMPGSKQTDVSVVCSTRLSNVTNVKINKSEHLSGCYSKKANSHE